MIRGARRADEGPRSTAAWEFSPLYPVETMQRPPPKALRPARSPSPGDRGGPMRFGECPPKLRKGPHNNDLSHPRPRAWDPSPSASTNASRPSATGSARGWILGTRPRMTKEGDSLSHPRPCAWDPSPSARAGFPLLPPKVGEGAPKGRMRARTAKPGGYCTSSRAVRFPPHPIASSFGPPIRVAARRSPHPALRATFSRRPAGEGKNAARAGFPVLPPNGARRSGGPS
jgi:hypothetical protein